MSKKAISMFTVIIMSLGILCGCKLPYNAVVIFSGAINDYKIVPDNSCFTSNFWRNNMIRTVFYENENYNSEESNGEQYFIDDTKPAERLYIIKNQEECNSIFIEPQSVDFEKEMILVYIGSTVNSRSVIVKQVKLEEKKLKVEFTVKKGKRGYKDSSMPKRRLILIKIAKLDIDAVEFAEI